MTFTSKNFHVSINYIYMCAESENIIIYPYYTYYSLFFSSALRLILRKDNTVRKQKHRLDQN